MFFKFEFGCWDRVTSEGVLVLLLFVAGNRTRDRYARLESNLEFRGWEGVGRESLLSRVREGRVPLRYATFLIHNMLRGCNRVHDLSLPLRWGVCGRFKYMNSQSIT